ncbi:hypothetical protein ACQ4LE_002957 [Meloidogyne hapla]|uniref:JmjC domain-containing protein n=1 Tax=Meloidogyne hapla TaxID=6305 RepID=A0A1I8BJ18_MELHA
MQPFILRGFLKEKQWPPMELWTEKYIRGNFGKNKGPVIVRFGSREHVNGEILHDHKSIRHQFESFSEMLDWMLGEQKLISPNSSTELNINSLTHWAYLDYRDILELLDEENASFVDWSKLNIFPSNIKNNWKDSTIWIGTPGSYTPCHYDTYGFNLHAQICGYKRWLLFPPKTDLNATRFPYEESSVFSSIDIIGQTMKKEGNKNIPSPFFVICEPGDLLFIPQKWWHSVQNIGKNKEINNKLCISVNKWFPTDNDLIESKKEALLKFMMSLNLNFGLLNLSEHICLTEQNSFENKNNLDELAFLVNERLNEEEEENEELINNKDSPESKRSKLDELINEEKLKFNEEYFYNNFLNNPLTEKIQIMEWNEIYRKGKDFYGTFLSKSKEISKNKNIKENIINPTDKLKIELFEAISSPKVLDILLNVFISRRNQKY